jgi:hypothetical protein
MRGVVSRRSAVELRMAFKNEAAQARPGSLTTTSSYLRSTEFNEGKIYDHSVTMGHVMIFGPAGAAEENILNPL